ncbi:DUF1361 domain-containing protein [Flavobacterium sp. IMCC34852]|uniref:DUF1361 domain-containing protein n=1 Tax=Flavobacterium rivulicola TaxID=2732161 RepID=A0A7Y3VYS6_9FLAO|nr:DUF1361 domain-containing protein [Flavobacterium sp. IMCC34852]NNT71731.1 DUF1361 domain-containing protein [Flavobacterium sp. IMCC34852]
MDALLKLFNQNKKANQLLLCYGLYCLSLLLVRAKITNSVYLFFLIWNVFLAFIPYVITLHLLTLDLKKTAQFKVLAIMGIWLAFVPNAFYIITDLVHLVNSDGHIFWLDLIILSSYALIGFAFGILSLLDFEKILYQFTTVKITSLIIPIICFLCGIGIYIGRILRYNSWDIISNPFELAYDLFQMAISLKSILFSIHFGVFIYFSFLIKKNLTSNNPNHGNINL